MPRKNARPAARKERAKFKAKMERKAKFVRASDNYRRNTMGLDRAIAGAMAASLFSSLERDRFRET